MRRLKMMVIVLFGATVLAVMAVMFAARRDLSQKIEDVKYAILIYFLALATPEDYVPE